MPSEKFSISTSRELFEALEGLAEARGQSRSDLIEMLLREHPMVEDEIRRRRGRPRQAAAKRGRSPEELAGLARAARRQWEKKEDAGEVAFLDR